MQKINMNGDLLRSHLVKLLEGDQAYMKMEKALKDVPFNIVHSRPEGFPYSIWQLVEHIRISQWDIIEFSKDRAHISPRWPDEYWPVEHAPKDTEQWQNSLEQIEKYQKELIEMINDKRNDLLKPFEWGSGQTLHRQVTVLAEHNAYHTGQILLLKKLLTTKFS